MAYRKPLLFDHQQASSCSVKSRTNFFENKKNSGAGSKSPTTITTTTKDDTNSCNNNNKPHYGTIDSAYETGSSAYNTVDSTYKSASCHHQGGTSSKEEIIIPVHVCSPLHQHNNYPKSPSTTSAKGRRKSDMSYIPSYIRTPVTTTTTGGKELLISEPTAEQSPTAVARHSRSNKSKDSKTSSTSSNSSQQQRTPTTAELRDKYVKRQQELQLSGRKSLKERLESLESDADVKLQVNLAARRRSEKKNQRQQQVATKQHQPTLPSPTQPPHHPVVLTTQQSTSTSSGATTINDDDVRNIQDTTTSKTSTTDKTAPTEKPEETDAKEKLTTPTNNSKDIQQSTPAATDDSTNTLYDTQDIKVKPAAIKWKATKKLPPLPYNQQGFNADVKPSTTNDNAATQWKSDTTSNTAPLPLPPNATVVSSSPSFCRHNQKTSQTSSAATVISSSATTTTAAPPESSMTSSITSSGSIVQPIKSTTQKTTKAPPPVTLTIDIKTANNSVVPVELRSPRTTSGGAGCDNTRSETKRGRRNGWVWGASAPTTPDDSTLSYHSGADHFVTSTTDKLQPQPQQVVAPVKFIPSVLRRNYSQRRHNHLHKNADVTTTTSQSSSTSSIVTACHNSITSAATTMTALTPPARLKYHRVTGDSLLLPHQQHVRNNSDDTTTSSNKQQLRREAVQFCSDMKKQKEGFTTSPGVSGDSKLDSSSAASSSSKRRSRSMTSRTPVTSSSKHQQRNNDHQGGGGIDNVTVRKPQRHKENSTSSLFQGRITLPGYDEDEVVSTSPMRNDDVIISLRHQQYVAAAVKFGRTDPHHTTNDTTPREDPQNEIPFIDETTPTEVRTNSTSNGDDDEEKSSDDVIFKKPPPSVRGEQIGEGVKKKSKKISGSEDRSLEGDSGEKVRNPRRKTMGNSTLMKRSTSAESIMSFSQDVTSSSTTDQTTTTDTSSNKVLMRKRSNHRSCSVDRNKTVLRRSYMMATGINQSTTGSPSPPTNTRFVTSRPPRRFTSRRKKSDSNSANSTPPLNLSTPQESPTMAESRKTTTSSCCHPLTSSAGGKTSFDNVIKEGTICFKVATIDKGKRTSSQKSWKIVRALLQGDFIYLCKETRNIDPTVFTEDTHGRGRPRRVSSAYHQQHHDCIALLLDDIKPLHIKGSLCEIAYTYVKRRNVFRLTTRNGSEYLFQAKDNEDMVSWLTAITNCSSADHDINKELIVKKRNQMEHTGPKPEKRTSGLPKKRSPKPSRHHLVPPTKDVDGSKRFKWRGSVNKIAKKFGQGNARMCGYAFGSHLEDCPSSPNNELIPFVVELCCRIVEEQGILVKGIYRVPGNTGTVNAVIEELNQKGPDIDIESDPRFKEVNVISSVLKKYFRSLPDPLFTNELYKSFISTNRKEVPDERLNGLRRLVHMLPGPHYETLKFLIQHLRRVADNQEENLMDIRNLAIVFGPTLVCYTVLDSLTSMVTDMSDQCRIVESILRNVDWFLTKPPASDDPDDDSSKDGNIAPPPTEHDDHTDAQIIPSINHLLVNVGRTTGNKDVDSDTTSESSKSKHSSSTPTSSESSSNRHQPTESFSRDVMTTLFGKKWKNVMTSSSNKKEGDDVDNDVIKKEDEDDDEFGFKELQKRREENIALGNSPLPPARNNDDHEVELDEKDGDKGNPQPQTRRQHRDVIFPVHVTAASNNNLMTSSKQHRTSINPGNPRISNLVTSSHRSPMMPRRNPRKIPSMPPQMAPVAPQMFHYDQQPLVYGDAPENRRFAKDPRGFSGDSMYVPFVLVPQSATVTSSTRRDVSSSAAADDASREPETKNARNEADEKIAADSPPPIDDDDSVDSVGIVVRIGETFEEKLKNLTNLDKKLEPSSATARCRPSPPLMFPLPPAPTTSSEVFRRVPPKTKKLTAQSMQRHNAAVAGGTGSEKSSIQIYRERRDFRRKQRDIQKANRKSTTSAHHHQLRHHRRNDVIHRCASEENVMAAANYDVTTVLIRNSSSPSSGDDKLTKIRRRHTLTGYDVDDDVSKMMMATTDPLPPPSGGGRRRKPSQNGSRKSESYL